MESPEGEQFPNAGCYLEVEPGRLLVFTSVMSEGYRPAAPSNGADLRSPAGSRLRPPADGGTHLPGHRHPRRPRVCERHRAMGFHEGWGAALDQLVALMS